YVSLHLIKHRTNFCSYFHICFLISAPDIIRFQRLTLMVDDVKRCTMIIYVKPFTDIFSVSVYLNSSAGKGVGNDGRYQFFFMLSWPVVIRTARNNNIHSMCIAETSYKHVG